MDVIDSSCRVRSIEFFRFLFMLQICLWHLGNLDGKMIHGYLGVEFFFILSGYLLYNSSCKVHSRGVLDFTIHKCKRLIPRVLCAYLLGFFVGIDVIYEYPYGVLHDVLCISGTGLNSHMGIYGHLWYISVLLIGGGIIYSLLKYNNRLTVNILLPVICLLGYNLILHSSDFRMENWSTVGGIYLPLLRGVANMGLGCILCKIQQKMHESIDLKYKSIFDISCFVSFIAVGSYMFSNDNEDIYAIIAYSLIIISAFSKTSLTNKLIKHKIWVKLGGLTLDMFILHPILFRPFGYMYRRGILDIGYFAYALVSIFIVIIVSYMFGWLYKRYVESYFE